MVNKMASFAKVSFTIAIIAVALYGLKIYFKGGVCRSDVRLDGKTVIVTGANTGIGKETAIDLAKRGAKVIIGCRSKERGEKAVIDIKRLSGNEDVHLKMIDLASFKSVRAFAEDILKSEVRLDILVNNAGVFMMPYSKTKDGFETHFQVNHLGHFLLTNLLLELIKKSAPSRIINVSSIAHRWGTAADLDDVGDEKKFTKKTAYGLGKLANVAFSKDLSRRLKGTNVSAYSLHPGFVETEVSRYLFNDYPILKILFTIMKPFGAILFKNSQEGAQTTICCAVEKGLEQFSGEYFADCAVAPMTEVAKDEAFAAKLWEYSVKATQLE